MHYILCYINNGHYSFNCKLKIFYKLIALYVNYELLLL